MKPSRQRTLAELQERLGIHWRNLSLLDIAFTHSSYINESGLPLEHNERLEYLGDSVLGLIVNEYLYQHFTEFREGEMARIKSSLVSERTLARVAGKLQLGEFLQMGRGESQSGGMHRPSNLADVFEALLAALYLDQGLEAVRTFVIECLKEEIHAPVSQKYSQNPKSELQEYFQKKERKVPVYRILTESGPDHRPFFDCVVVVDERELGRGQGFSRKSAEQAAAQAALKAIGSKSTDS